MKKSSCAAADFVVSAGCTAIPVCVLPVCLCVMFVCTCMHVCVCVCVFKDKVVFVLCFSRVYEPFLFVCGSATLYASCLQLLQELRLITCV